MSSTHSSAHDSFGRKKSYLSQIQIHTHVCLVDSKGQLHSKLGVTGYPTTRSTLKISRLFLKRCCPTVFKTSMSQQNYLSTSKSKQSQQLVSNLNTPLHHVLRDKFDQVFLLILMQLLLLWMNLSISKQNSKQN